MCLKRNKIVVFSGLQLTYSVSLSKVLPCLLGMLFFYVNVCSLCLIDSHFGGIFFGLFFKNYVSCLSKVLPFLLGQKALFESTICFSDLCICST